MSTATERKVLAEAKTATIYYMGDFGLGYARREVRDVVVKCGKFAQYDHALFIEFTDKGKRTRRLLTQDYKPNVVILAGHGHFEPADCFVETSPGVRESRYSSFDDRYASDFAADLAGYMIDSRAEMVFDGRGWNSYRGCRE